MSVFCKCFAQVLGEFAGIEWDFVLFPETQIKLSDCIFRSGHNMIMNLRVYNSDGLEYLFMHIGRKVFVTSIRFQIELWQSKLRFNNIQLELQMSTCLMLNIMSNEDTVVDTYDELSSLLTHSNTQV